MKKETAKAIVEMAFQYAGRFDKSVADVQFTASDEEFRVYRLAVGRVIGYMYADVLRYVFREHPELEPEELRLEYINIPPLENPIATRELWARDEQGTKMSVTVLLAAPLHDKRTGEYDCEYQIRGRGNNRTHRRSGVDPMEALLKATRAIGWELQVEREKKGKKIWWRDENDTLQDLGFPVPNGPHGYETSPMNKQVAKDIATAAEEYAQSLRETLETLRKELPKEELDRYAEGLGTVLQRLADDMLAPIYKEHPELKPAGLET